MSKKLNNLKWETVALDGFPASMTENFHGFVGLEECTSYGLDKEVKRSKKKKPEKKQQNTDIEDNHVENKKKKLEKKRQNTDIENNQVEKKKVKLSNGFIVETIESVSPSQTNKICNENKEKKGKNKQTNDEKQANIKIETKTPVNTNAKKPKAKLGEDITEVVSDLTPEDMLTWAEFKLPESIMKALTELGFKQPTKIQQLSLPAAVHGRRDILGAAETGSGKTLAFGLPILSGILKLKEKAAAKGLDVYDIPYRKPLSKRKNEDIPVEVNKGKGKKDNKKGKQNEVKAKESSEDGYSSGKESDKEEVSEEDDNEESGEDSAGEEKDEEEGSEEEDNEESGEDSAGEEKDEEFLEEYDIPLRKKETSTDEGNESDNSDNYIHLSDMLDSDDLADSSGDEGSSDLNDEVQSDDDAELGDDDEVGNYDNDASEVDDEPGEDGQGEEDENEEGIGCVNVLDNIEIPGHVVTKTGKPLYALILTPTRELAIQISRHLIAAAKYTGIRVATIVGGMAAVKQERVLRSGPEIVVATPGRLWELVTQGQPHLQQLDSVKFLAIDETDRMIERGHFEELHPLLERLNVDDARRSARQNFVFSATLTLVHDLPVHMKGKKVTKRGKILNRKIEKMTPEQKVNRLVKMIGMTDPKVVDITSKNLGTAETLTESRIACALEHKDAYLYYIIKRHPGRTLVFCNSIGSVKRLAQLFTLLRCSPLPLHASMPQRQRLKNLERFRDSAHSVLIATDVAARGLDVPHVSHVVHYQVPRTAENYVHRSGRTARATREGLTILLMEPKEAYLYNKLCRTLNKTSELPTFPVTSQTLSPIMDLMKLAREVDALELKRRRTAQAHGWRERVAREMDIIVDDDDVPVKEIDPSIEKALKVKKRQLDAMLSRPVYPRGFSFKYPTLNDPAALSMPEENALQVMKNAIESGELKKEKRKSKNAPLLKLQKTFSKKNKNKNKMNK